MAEKQLPVFRVMMPEKQKDGKEKLRSVGAVWKNISKDGKEYYTLSIDNLRLLAFRPEEQKKL